MINIDIEWDGDRGQIVIPIGKKKNLILHMPRECLDKVTAEEVPILGSSFTSESIEEKM